MRCPVALFKTSSCIERPEAVLPDIDGADGYVSFAGIPTLNMTSNRQLPLMLSKAA